MSPQQASSRTLKMRWVSTSPYISALATGDAWHSLSPSIACTLQVLSLSKGGSVSCGLPHSQGISLLLEKGVASHGTLEPGLHDSQHADCGHHRQPVLRHPDLHTQDNSLSQAWAIVCPWRGRSPRHAIKSWHSLCRKSQRGMYDTVGRLLTGTEQQFADTAPLEHCQQHKLAHQTAG